MNWKFLIEFLGEWIAPATATYLINQLLTSNDPDIVDIANNVDWYFIPFANPGMKLKY